MRLSSCGGTVVTTKEYNHRVGGGWDRRRFSKFLQDPKCSGALHCGESGRGCLHVGCRGTGAADSQPRRSPVGGHLRALPLVGPLPSPAPSTGSRRHQQESMMTWTWPTSSEGCRLRQARTLGGRSVLPWVAEHLDMGPTDDAAGPNPLSEGNGLRTATITEMHRL